jgi:azurin
MINLKNPLIVLSFIAICSIIYSTNPAKSAGREVYAGNILKTTDSAQIITIEMAFLEGMKFSKTLFSAKAGQKIIINVINTEEHAHNMVIGKPGTLNRIGAMTDSLISDHNAWKTDWVPQTSDILQKTPMLADGETYKLEFIVPDEPGDYPFVCTFPLHWQRMNGIMRVTK